MYLIRDVIDPNRLDKHVVCRLKLAIFIYEKNKRHKQCTILKNGKEIVVRLVSLIFQRRRLMRRADARCKLSRLAMKLVTYITKPGTYGRTDTRSRRYSRAIAKVGKLKG